MKKKIIFSLTVVLLLLCSLAFSSCASLIFAAIEEGKQLSALKKEAEITGGSGINWRSELTYDKSHSKIIASIGLWYINDISVDFLNLSKESQYKGISIMRCVQNSSYVFAFALVSKDDQPAGETSSFTIRRLGESGNNTWTIKYILSEDGKSINITDLGRLNSPPLRIGQYLNSDAQKDANKKALEGYGSFTVKNMSSNHSITQISLRGISNSTFSQTYQVNINPAASGAAGVLGGGSFQVGDIIAGKKVIPIGVYELTLVWSNGARTNEMVTITSTGLIGNYNL